MSVGTVPSDALKTDLREKYLSVRQQTEFLCAPLNTEDYIPQSIDFASPPKWHLAHVSWFFEEMILTKNLADYDVFDSSFNFLFNSYYQTVGERAIRAQRGLITRPTVEQVYAYRKYIDHHMLQLMSLEMDQALVDLVILGLNHEQQHQELLLTDLKYTFALNPTHPVYQASTDFLGDSQASDYVSNDWLSLKEGLYEIGYKNKKKNKQRNDQESVFHLDDFCFDNELGAHKVYLHDCQIAKGLVTNGEFIDFINAGAYQQCSHWLDEGWDWVTQNHINSPLYWRKIGKQWHQYTLGGFKPVDPNGVLAHVSYYEANAFASWKRCRLPTEFEWEVASSQFNWGLRWEWTVSAYQAYPQFSISEGAVGEYNGKFMVNQMVLRGASLATAPGHSRASYRNFFHPHFQWQFSGIRLAK